MSDITSPYRTLIQKNVENTYNVRDEFKHSTVKEIKDACDTEALDFAVMALNVEGDLNVAMMIRTASLMGAKDFYVFGRKKFDNRAMVGADKYINLHKIHGLKDDGTTLDIEAFRQVIKDLQYTPVFIEQGGIPLKYVHWPIYDFPQAQKGLKSYTNRSIKYPLFIFGNEGTGIPPEFMTAFPDALVVSIPQRGALRSFNVGASCSIVLWDYISKGN